MCSRDEPWGIASLSRRHQLEVAEGNLLMDASTDILGAVVHSGGTGCKEHHAVRGRKPYASIFATSYWKVFVAWGCFFFMCIAVTFPMCWFGSVARKLMIMVFFRIDPALLAKCQDLHCFHSSHEPSSGLDEHGRSRVRSLRSSPPGFGRELA